MRVWIFRVLTSALPSLATLEIQLERHALDPWILGAGAVATAIAVIAHYVQASVDPAKP